MYNQKHNTFFFFFFQKNSVGIQREEKPVNGSMKQKKHIKLVTKLIKSINTAMVYALLHHIQTNKKKNN